MKFSKSFAAILAASTCVSHGAVVTFTQAIIENPSSGFFAGADSNGSTDGATTSINESNLSSPADNHQVSAIAIAGQGILKASVSETRTGSLTTIPLGPVFSEAWTGGSAVNSQVSSYASFTDSLTVSATGLAGQSGSAVFRFRVDGNVNNFFTSPTVGLPMGLAADGASQAFQYFAGWSLYIGPVGDYESAAASAGAQVAGSFSGMTGSSSGGDGTTDGIYEFTVELIYGEAFDIEYSLAAFLNVTNLDPSGTIIGELSASFLNTAELEGIEFRDSGGATVSNTSLLTGSGASYTVIPEPSALLLTLFGIFPLLRRKR